MSAERGRVVALARRIVEGIVDPAQPESARRLSIHGERLGYFVAGDEARHHAVGLGGSGLGHQLRPGAIVRENAVENLVAVLVEVVVAKTPGNVEAACRNRRLAEGGGLPQVVVQIRPEQVILGGPESRGTYGVAVGLRA